MRRALFVFALVALAVPLFARANTGYDAIVKAYMNVAQQRALAKAALQSHGVRTKDTGTGPEVDLRIVFPPSQTGLENLEVATLVPVDGSTHQSEGLVIQKGGTTVGVTFQPFKDVRPGHTYDVVVSDARSDKYKVGRVAIGSRSVQAYTIHAPLLGAQSQPYTGPHATGNTLQPWMMGLVGATITPALLKAAGYPNAKVRGVVVLSIVNGTAAQRAGIQRGDIIVVVNRVAIASMEQLLQLTANRRSGVATTLIFFRNGTPLQVLVPVNGSTATPQQWRPPTIGPGYVRPTSGPANRS